MPREDVRLGETRFAAEAPPEGRVRDLGARVELAVTGRGSARVEIVDVRGRRVASFDSTPLPTVFPWGRAASGVYFARITDSENRTTVRRILRLP